MPFCRQTRPSCPAVKAIFSPLWSSHTHQMEKHAGATDNRRRDKQNDISFLFKKERPTVWICFLKSFFLEENFIVDYLWSSTPLPCVCVCRAKKEKGGPSITSICWFWVFPGTTSTNGKKKKKPVVSFGRLYLQGGGRLLIIWNILSWNSFSPGCVR